MRPGSEVGVIRARRRGRSRLLGAENVFMGHIRDVEGDCWGGNGAPDRTAIWCASLRVCAAIRMQGRRRITSQVCVEPARAAWVLGVGYSGRATVAAADTDHPPRARRSLTLYCSKRSGRSPEQLVCPGSGGEVIGDHRLTVKHALVTSSFRERDVHSTPDRKSAPGKPAPPIAGN